MQKEKSPNLIDINTNKHEADTKQEHHYTSENMVPEISSRIYKRQLLKGVQEKSTLLNKQTLEAKKAMASDIYVAKDDRKNQVNNATELANKTVPEITSETETILKGNQERSAQVIVENDEALAETVHDSTKNKVKTNTWDSIPQKVKKWGIRPYFGIVFNQLKPFSVPGKTNAYSLLSNYSGGLLIDYYINKKTMLTFNLGYIKLPSKIEFLKKDSNSNEEIIKVLNTNNLILGLEFSKFNKRKNICFNIGSQIAISGKKRNFVEQGINSQLIYHNQKQLPQDFQTNYFSKIDFLLNMGLGFYNHRSVLRINYYQGLIDVSRTTKLFNPHTFVQLNYAYQLFRF